MILFLSKYWKLSKIKEFKVYYRIESIIACKPKLLITFDSLIKMEWLKAFYGYITLENQFQILVYEKSDFLISARTTRPGKKILRNILELFVKSSLAWVVL